MIDITLMVLTSEDGTGAKELGAIMLPGVPRVGETVIAKGAEFTVRGVTWHEGWVSLELYSEKYGYAFPIP